MLQDQSKLTEAKVMIPQNLFLNLIKQAFILKFIIHCMFTIAILEVSKNVIIYI